MANNAAMRRNAKLLFEQWRASLAERDRSIKSLEDNFDYLFYEFDRHSITFDIAHEYLDLAIAAHLPDKKMLKWTYNKTKGFGQSMEEFHESWKSRIRDAATNVFYSRFPLKDDSAKEETNLPSGMSKDEYLRQRRYANSFPALDLSKIPDPEDEGIDDDVSFSIEDLE